MGLVSRGRTRVVAVTSVVGMAVALLLTGCSGDSPEGSTIDETTPTKTVSPSPTPTPTPTASDEEQKAIDAATQAYNRYQDVAATLGKAPQDYTISAMKTELYKVGGDPLAGDRLSILRTYQVKGLAYGGRRTIDKISSEGVKVKVKKGQYPEVLLRVCSDSSKVTLVDVKTGKVVNPPPKDPKAVNHAKVWFYEEAWHLVAEEPGAEGEKC
jgi:hypothetical protein